MRALFPPEPNVPTRALSREEFLYPALSPLRSGRLPLDALHTMYWEESGKRARRAGGVPARRAGRRQLARPSTLFRPALLSHRHLRPARRRARRRRSVSSPTTRRRIWSPTSSACASTSASSAGWCSADRGDRRLRSPTREAHPDRVLGLVLRGIFLCRPQEIHWFLYDLRFVSRSRGAHSRSSCRRPSAATCSARITAG